MKNLIRQLLTLLILITMSCGALCAAAPEEEEQDSAADEPVQEVEESPQVPDSSRLKRRELGTSLDRFIPSEEISTDNAVPFPVDI
ncbi:MAG: hypothetical protein OXC84_03650 [Gammaproteobacteria bacterium]|nr:hypothetical protein [Gammaproteobacteria bacterium]